MPDLLHFAFLLSLLMADRAIRTGRAARLRTAARMRAPVRIAAFALAVCAAALAVGTAL